jgi:L,D-peptidoglycan transpeptidase YkuD (ErfK/YbiS/YcfS/YnhG family)
MERRAAELSTPEELLGVQPVFAASRAAHPKRRSRGVNFMSVRVDCTLLGRQRDCNKLACIARKSLEICERCYRSSDLSAAGQSMKEKFTPLCRVLIGVAMLLFLVGCVLHQEVPYQLTTPINELAECKQMILVVVPSWKSTSGSIRLFERSSGSKWTGIRPSFPCVVGKSGLGWGIGLHGTGLMGEPRKKEGDGRAPAGIFQLNICMGIAPLKKALRFPYRQITATTEAVYDPKSRYYNRVVDRSSVHQVDWSSAEQMLRPDGLYRWVVVVEHNWKSYPGFGSCIFLHLWLGKGIPTIGCTGMSLEDVKFLVYWLDANKHPLLVQLPESIYLRVKQSWQLP